MADPFALPPKTDDEDFTLFTSAHEIIIMHCPDWIIFRSERVYPTRSSLRTNCDKNARAAFIPPEIFQHFARESIHKVFGDLVLIMPRPSYSFHTTEVRFVIMSYSSSYKYSAAVFLTHELFSDGGIIFGAALRVPAGLSAPGPDVGLLKVLPKSSYAASPKNTETFRCCFPEKHPTGILLAGHVYMCT